MGGLPRRKRPPWEVVDYREEQDSIHFATASRWMQDPSLWEDVQEDRMRRRAPKQWGTQRHPTPQERVLMAKLQRNASRPPASSAKWFWRGRWRLR